MAKAPVRRATALRTASSRGSEGLGLRAEGSEGVSRTAWDSLVSAASVATDWASVVELEKMLISKPP